MGNKLGGERKGRPTQPGATMYTLVMHDGTQLDNFDTIDNAVRHAITYWRESDQPVAYTVVNNDDQWVHASIVPAGTFTALVVYCNGNIARYREIRYDMPNNKTLFKLDGNLGFDGDNTVLSYSHN